MLDRSDKNIVFPFGPMVIYKLKNNIPNIWDKKEAPPKLRSDSLSEKIFPWQKFIKLYTKSLKIWTSNLQDFCLIWFYIAIRESLPWSHTQQYSLSCNTFHPSFHFLPHCCLLLPLKSHCLHIISLCFYKVLNSCIITDLPTS